MRKVSKGDDLVLAVNGRCAEGKKVYQLGDQLFCYTDSREVFTGRYYQNWSESQPKDGHFILANGVFTDTDGTRFFYVYDPNVVTTGSRQKYYYFGDPQLPKGKYRVWRFAEMDDAIQKNGEGVKVAVEVRNNPAAPIPVLPALASSAFGTMPESIAIAESIEFLEHVNYPDGTTLTPNQVVLKSWRILNSGQSDFGFNYRLVQFEGMPIHLYGESEVGQVLSGDWVVVSAYVQAPSRPGHYLTRWRVVDSFGVPIPGTLNFDFSVVGDVNNAYDKATFISDVTFPDGTGASAGQSFVKTWRVRNSGTSTWNGYKLIFLQGDQMGGVSPVNIPTTSSGQEVNISVSLQAPATTGNKVGYWQIINRDGVHVPGGRLSVNINVVNSTSNDHIAAFSASPSSPSSASTVMLFARVNWWAQFRAMRVKMDNQVIGETAAAEHTFSWDAGSASRGDHTLVLEVADHTDTSWSHPDRRVLLYTLQGTSAPANHAPNRPTPSSPYDWYVYYSGNTAQLCAQANGDPDGDAITGYYFDVYESAQLWNSGWTGSNCVTTGGLGPYDYKWRVKVRDSLGAESAWSDSWHFTLVNPSLSISELYFQPQDANSEVVKIRTCTTGQGGIGITMRVSVNDANDGSGNGAWHIIKEQGSPCFNDTDAPVWYTLEYGDGPHRVRSEAHGLQTGWNGAAVREETYTLPHRRPASPELVAPVPASRNVPRTHLSQLPDDHLPLGGGDPRSELYPTRRLNPSPENDSSPIFRQTFGPSVTEQTVNFGQDYPTLYWQITATNDKGSTGSGDQIFGIDRTAPSCTVQALPATTVETTFQVGWGGTDNLAGIRTYDIQVRDTDRGTWSDWFTDLPAAKTYDLFTGQPGHRYEFRCRATDNAGNRPEYPDAVQAWTMVDPSARPPTPWWNAAYSGKRNIVVLNNMPGVTLPAGYPVRVHFDSNTTPTAAEVYASSQSSPKCNDLRVVYGDATELDRVTQNCTITAIDLWFRTQVAIPAGSTNSVAHQLYYGNPNAGSPPGSPTTVFDPVIDANTVGLWYMHEGGGSALYDSSGYGNNCSIDSTTTWVAPSKFSGALHFLGGTDGPTISCGSSSVFNLQTFTVEMWLKRTGTAWGRLAGHLGNNQNRWLLTLTENGMKVDIWPCSTCGGEGFEGRIKIADTTNWHHIAFTLQNSTLKMYVDGQLDTTSQVVWGNIRSGTPPLTIGSAESIQRAFAEITHFACQMLPAPASLMAATRLSPMSRCWLSAFQLPHLKPAVRILSSCQ